MTFQASLGHSKIEIACHGKCCHQIKVVSPGGEALGRVWLVLFLQF